MEKTPPVLLRRNNSYNRLIQSAIIICSMILLGFSAMQVQGDNVKVHVTEKKVETVELSAGVSRMKEPQPEKMVAGLSKQLMKFAKEPLPEVEELNVETVTTSIETEDVADVTETEDVAEEEKTEPEILYKSLEEVKISRNMDLTETTGLSREDFCKLLANFKYDYAGFYKQNAGLIWDLSQKYQVNEIFICGVFGLESYYGSDDRHISTHNYGSIMRRTGGMVKYSSDAEGIEANFRLFANSYLSTEGKYYKGVTLDSIGNTYCPPTPDCPSWADKVYSCMQYFLE